MRFTRIISLKNHRNQNAIISSGVPKVTETASVLPTPVPPPRTPHYREDPDLLGRWGTGEHSSNFWVDPGVPFLWFDPAARQQPGFPWQGSEQLLGSQRTLNDKLCHRLLCGPSQLPALSGFWGPKVVTHGPFLFTFSSPGTVQISPPESHSPTPF